MINSNSDEEVAKLAALIAPGTPQEVETAILRIANGDPSSFPVQYALAVAGMADRLPALLQRIDTARKNVESIHAQADLMALADALRSSTSRNATLVAEMRAATAEAKQSLSLFRPFSVAALLVVIGLTSFVGGLVSSRYLSAANQLDAVAESMASGDSVSASMAKAGITIVLDPDTEGLAFSISPSPAEILQGENSISIAFKPLR